MKMPVPPRTTDRAGLVTNGVTVGDVPDLVRSEECGLEQLKVMLRAGTKSTYTHDEVFGQFCNNQGYIHCPVDMAFEYAANVYSLEEYTFSLRKFHYVGGGLYKGTEALGKDTCIYMQVDAYPDSRVVDYFCAWDQGEEMWMRYHFRFLDAMPTIRRAGTIMLWTNCKHPYYDRAVTDVPSYISEPRARTDRVWVGDVWKQFYAIHELEFLNLKRILEYRFAHA